MFIGSVIIVFGAIIQATCRGLAQFMIGRFILGFGCAITSAAGPTYVSEMAHPAYRGIMTGMFNSFWFIGGIPGNFVPYGTRNIASSMSWRIPLWCQMVYSGIVLIGSPFLPETPRWLIANGRHEDALEVMVSWH
jgi:MFS family permease